MRRASDQPAEEIKDKVSSVSKSILDVVAEYVQIKHVKNQVKDAPVQEHGGEKGVKVFPPHYRLRNHPELPNDILQKTVAIKPGGKEDHCVDDDDDSGEVGRGQRTVLVSNGNQRRFTGLSGDR